MRDEMQNYLGYQVASDNDSSNNDNEFWIVILCKISFWLNSDFSYVTIAFNSLLKLFIQIIGHLSQENLEVIGTMHWLTL